MTMARTSDRKMSDMEKHTPIAAHGGQQRLNSRGQDEGGDAPSIAALRPISFSDSCKRTMSSAGVRSSLWRTRGKFELTLPNPWGGADTTELKTDRTRFWGSGFPLRIDTMRGRCRKISAWGKHDVNERSRARPRRQTRLAYLVHFGNNGNEKACIEIAFADKTFDEGNKLRAGPAVLREDGQHPQREGFGTWREGPEKSEQLAVRRSQSFD